MTLRQARDSGQDRPGTAPMTLALRFAARSDVGLVRKRNEDSGYAGPHLLAVADGVGGNVAGEVASAAAITAIAALDAQDPGPDLASALAGAVAAASRRLQELISSDPSVEGMGTTLTALLARRPTAAPADLPFAQAKLPRC